MKPQIFGAQSIIVLALSLCAVGLLLLPSTATAQPKFDIKPVAEKKLKQLPAGPLYWQVENFPTLAQARAAEGPTSLASEVAGKVWLFTLGPRGGSTRDGSKIVEIGPVPPITAPEYLLRINNAGGPPGARTPVHTHPGSEAFYVLARPAGPKASTRRESYRYRPVHAWTWSRHTDGSLQQRHERSECPSYVRGGCGQAILIAGQVRLS